jgi:flagellar hook-basal body complex protein FliE
MSFPAIPPIGFSPMQAPMVGTGTTATGVASIGQAGGAHPAVGPSGPNTDFADLVMDGLDRLESVNNKVEDLAVKAATGDLQNIHDYTIAATEATVTTQLTAAVRNKALEAFNEIMRMQV